jgi:hypothetical protein
MKPGYLYKYKKFDEHTENVVKNDLLAFTNRKRLNDLHEIKLIFKTKSSTKTMDEQLVEHIDQIFPEYTSIQKMMMFIGLKKFDGNPIEATRKQLQESMQEDADSVGVLCLTEDPLNELMWGHYGDGCAGYCLKIRIDPSLEIFGKELFKVIYDNNPVFVPYPPKDDKDYQNVLITKPKSWEYEKEWRIIYPGMIDSSSGVKIYGFPSGIIEEIILGSRMKSENRDSILRWNKGRKRIRYLHSSEDSYEFRIENHCASAV